MKKDLLTLFICLFSFFSCDHTYEYTYEVTNESDSEVKIDLKASRFDSSYLVGTNDTKILFVKEHGVEAQNGPYFKDVSYDLDEFIVTKDRTLISKKDYLDNSSWIYNDGWYRATITNEEFE